MKKRSKDTHLFIRFWLPLVAWLLFIFFMSTGTFSAENTYSVLEPVLRFLFPHLSPDTIAALHNIIRKGAHVFEYFVLGLLLLRALRAFSGGVWKWRWVLLALIGVALWALGDEFHQSFVPTRTASMVDVGIDTAGGALAQFVAVLWYMMKSLAPRRCERKRA
jgi:VanZ family protein